MVLFHDAEAFFTTLFTHPSGLGKLDTLICTEYLAGSWAVSRKFAIPPRTRRLDLVSQELPVLGDADANEAVQGNLLERALSDSYPRDEKSRRNWNLGQVTGHRTQNKMEPTPTW